MTITGTRVESAILGSELVFEGVVGQILSLRVSKVRRFPNQPRTYFDKRKLEELTQSIREIGQKHPIIVREVTGDPDHEYEIVDGERRWIACKNIGKEFILAIVKSIDDEDDQYVDSVVANMARASHTSLEEAFAIHRIENSPKMAELNIGERIEKIARMFGWSVGWVRQRRQLLRLDPRVQAMMSLELPEDQRLVDAVAVFISNLHPELQYKIATHVVEKNLTLNQARFYARKLAEETGQSVGRDKDGLSPRAVYQMCLRFATKAQIDLSHLLIPSVVSNLKRRGQKDLDLVASEIDKTIKILTELRTALGSSSEDVKPAPKPVVTPTPAPTHPKVESVVSSSNGNGHKLSKDEEFLLAGAIFSALFYGGRTAGRAVNLSRSALESRLKSNNYKVVDLDWAVRDAMKLARERWRSTPSGSEEEKRFFRMVSRFRHDFGDAKTIDESMKFVLREDKSRDPVSL